MRRLGLILALGAAAVDAQTPEIRLVRVAGGMPLPVDIQHAGDESGRLFVVQQGGLIRIVRNGVVAARPFLDLSSRTRANGECGLLGLAFPPEFARKQYFYVNYTDTRCQNSVVARYRVGDSPDVADSVNEEVILTQPQPFANHNGGQIRFGPDGFLYIGFGDGGSGGDPQNNALNRRTWLGKLLRIDVESVSQGYRVPPSNPFVGVDGVLPEIWALGLRNPWRFSFDRETGDLWIGDVGQNRAEEIDFQPASSRGGENYGWRTMEGMQCFNPPRDCDRTGLTLPVLEYTRERGDISVTGGVVYRGARWPGLRGTYLYADYASGRIWGLRREGTEFRNRLLRESGFNITAFGEDEAGEVYLTHHGAGEIYRVEAAEAPPMGVTSAVNGASFESGLVAGSLATLFTTGVVTAPGITVAPSLPLPRALAGIAVTISGRDAPLYGVANVNGQEQINVQVPFETAGNVATVVVTRGGQAAPALEAPLRAVQPGIFVASDGTAILVRARDDTLAAPVRRQELVYLYATGLGAVDNPPQTGAASPLFPLAAVRAAVSVSLGGLPCDVQFAGLAPGLVGVYQVNFRIPDGLATGSHNLVVTANAVSSRAARVVVE